MKKMPQMQRFDMRRMASGMRLHRSKKVKIYENERSLKLQIFIYKQLAMIDLP